MCNGFTSLRHDTIVSGDYEHDNICALRTTCAHLSKRGMTGCIKECDETSLLFNLIRADMLSDTASFTGRHFRLTDGIQQAGLAVIDMTENGHHWRARF